MKYRNRGVRCPDGFDRDLVRCPVCDDVSQYAHAGVLGNDYAAGYRRKSQVISKRGSGRARAQRARGYTYGRDVGGGR